MCSDIAIRVEGLTKTYRVFGHPADRLRQAFSFGRRHHYRRFTALDNVSFEIKRGETVGVVGRNGSGKSTLLQLVCGVLKPSAGSVIVNGKVSALLELGAGFHPEFTGRENIYFLCTVLGMPQREIEARVPSIEEFADIGEFIDQPVRTYSNGMFVRLAFAVATSTDPDILIVDEALSVGDVAFQHKSGRRMQELTNAGVTLLVVSHDRATITAFCDRCILIDQGVMLIDGKPSDVFDYYHASAAAKGGQQITRQQLDSERIQVISGTGEAQVETIRLMDAQHREVQLIDVGADVILEFVVKVNQPIPRLVMGFTIRDCFGQEVYGTNTNSFGKSVSDPAAGRRYIFTFTFCAYLGVGSHSISTALVSTNDRLTNNYECRELALFFEVQNLTRLPFGGSVWLNPSLTIEVLQ